MLKMFKYSKEVNINCLLCGKNKADFDIQIQTSNGAFVYCNICKKCLKSIKEEFANIKID